MSGVHAALVDPTERALHAALPELGADTIALIVQDTETDRDVRALVERRGDHILAVLAIPVHDDVANTVVYRDLDALLTRDRLVTVRRSTAEGETAILPRLDDVEDGASPDSLFHLLFDDVAEAYLTVVDGIYDEIDELEDAVDRGARDDVLHRLSAFRHDLLHTRRTVTALRSSVRRIVDGRIGGTNGGPNPLLSREVEAAFTDTYETLLRATDELDIARDLITGVRDHLQAKAIEMQNEVVRKLTVVASLVLVPTLITGFFGQNFVEAGHRWWWSVAMSVGLIIGTTVIQLAFFRWRRWI